MTDITVAYHYDHELYRVPQSLLVIPLVIPVRGLQSIIPRHCPSDCACLCGSHLQNVQYTYLSDVECVSETGAADNVYIFVCGKDRWGDCFGGEKCLRFCNRLVILSSLVSSMLSACTQLHPACVSSREYAAQRTRFVSVPTVTGSRCIFQQRCTPASMSIPIIIKCGTLCFVVSDIVQICLSAPKCDLSILHLMYSS